MLLLACSGGQAEPTESEPPEPEVAPESQSESEVAPESAPESESAPEAEHTEPPEPGTLRFVVAHDGPELLGSESRQLDALREGLAREHTVDAADVTESEGAWLSDGGALPESWARFETVVVLRVAEPRTLRRGRRMSRGLRAVHVLRPPSPEPVYTLEGGPVGLNGAEELGWIRALLAALEEGEDE